MSANILSTKDILVYIEQFINAKYPDMDMQAGTDLYDLVAYGNAQAGAKIFEEIANVEKLQSIFTTEKEDLDLVARNYNLIRKRPTSASGYVILFTESFSSDIFIPDNSIVSTRGSSNLTGVSFRTIGDYTMLFNSKSTYFNAENGRYEITVPITALLSGIEGNQGINKISLVQSTISQIEGCSTVAPTTGGREVETDRALQQRIALSWVASSIGTRFGYKQFIVNRDEVVDAYAVGPYDSDSVRQGVDIYTITSSPLTNFTQSIAYANDTYTTINNQPLIDLISIKNTSLSPVQLLVEGVSFSVNKQINGPFSGSTVADSSTARIEWISPWASTVEEVVTQPNTFTMANSGSPVDITVVSTDAYKNARITITNSFSLNHNLTRTVTAFSYDSDNSLATFTTNDFLHPISAGDTFSLDPRPNIGDTVETTYLYNTDVSTLQTYVDQTTTNVVGADVLIKTGYQAKFYLALSINIFSQYDFTTVKAKVENALIQYISSLRLGDNLQLSDLVVVAQTGLGTDYTIVEVDSVDINTESDKTYIVRWDGTSSIFDSSGIINIESREYVTLENLTTN